MIKWVSISQTLLRKGRNIDALLDFAAFVAEYRPAMSIPEDFLKEWETSIFVLVLNSAKSNVPIGVMKYIAPDRVRCYDAATDTHNGHHFIHNIGMPRPFEDTGELLIDALFG
jgi:hypothetical protein